MSNDPLRFVLSVTRSRCTVFAFRHRKHRRFEGNWVLIARLTDSFGIEHERGRSGPVTRSAFLPLPADCLVELVFVNVLIDISFIPLGWGAGRCDLRRLGGLNPLKVLFGDGLNAMEVYSIGLGTEQAIGHTNVKVEMRVQ
jgi:hypothetical protein